MIDLQAADDGVIVPVRAQPKARRNAIVGTHAGRLRIAVTDPPEKGKANKSLAEILAAALKIAPSRVQLITGATSAQKKFLVAGFRWRSFASCSSRLWHPNRDGPLPLFFPVRILERELTPCH